jgi:intein/homing endonuclease
MFQVVIGDKIKAFDTKNKKDHFVEVQDIFENEVELYEIELEDGRKIKSSLNHKFLTEKNGMVKLSEILNKKYKIVTD